jgi:hypothetical protein
MKDGTLWKAGAAAHDLQDWKSYVKLATGTITEMDPVVLDSAMTSVKEVRWGKIVSSLLFSWKLLQ